MRRSTSVSKCVWVYIGIGIHKGGAFISTGSLKAKKKKKLHPADF